MKRQITTGALAAVLILSSLASTACGNATTLARVGATVVQVAKGIQGEIDSLGNAGLLKDDKLARANKTAAAITIAANALEKHLNDLTSVTAGNKAEITAEIAKTVSLVAGLLQNPDVAALGPDNLLVKVLTFANITLQQISVVFAAVQVSNPKQGIASTPGRPESVPMSSIKIKIGAPPKGAEKYFK